MTTNAGCKDVIVQYPLAVRSIQNGVTFLVIEKCTNGIRIRQSAKNGHKLNRFWRVWVREMLQKAPAKYQLGIELFKKDVRVTSVMPLESWVWTAYNLLATIQPLKLPVTRTKNTESNRSVQWSIRENAVLSTIIEELQLPSSAARHFHVYSTSLWVQLTVSGVGKRKRTTGLSEAALLVELKIAQAYRSVANSTR